MNEKVLKENSIETEDISESTLPKLDKLGRAYATGRRKTSVSRVWIKHGSNKISVNGKSSKDYFKRKIYSTILEEPLFKTDYLDKLEVFATVSGGGLSGQAGALRHGISKALSLYDIGFRPALKKIGFITRDPRVVERKKSGLAKARRSYQFSKR